MKNDFREFYDVDYIMHNATEEELYHFGVEGMKWGRRRYQNPDGSLTPLGAQHYGKQLAKLRNETKSNLSDYRAYAKKELDYELKGKNTKSTSKKKDKYKKRYDESLAKENAHREQYFSKKQVKNIKVQDDPDKFHVNNNSARNTALGSYLAGPLGTLPEAIKRNLNNKYYDSTPANLISGQNMFVTLNDGRIVPIDLNRFEGGMKYNEIGKRNLAKQNEKKRLKNEILDKEFKKRYKR